MTKRLLLLPAFIMISSLASAMPSSLNMTCSEVVQLVNTRGAVVLSTGPGLFDRYVSTDSYCGAALAATAAWIPTLDSAQCFVGATCTIPRQGTN